MDTKENTNAIKVETPPFEHMGRINNINSFVISRDGKSCIFSYGQGFLKLLDLDDLEFLSDLNYNGEEVTSLALSNDGRFLFSGSVSGIIRKWDLQEEQIVEKFKGHNEWVSTLSLSQGDKYLISGSSLLNIKIWKPENHKLLQEFAAGQIAPYPKTSLRIRTHNIIADAKITNDYKFLVACKTDGTIWVWDLKTANLETTHDLQQGKWGDYVYILPNDRTILACGKIFNAVNIWDLDTGEPIRLLGLFCVHCVIIDKDGLLLCGSSFNDEDVWIFNYDKNQMIAKLEFNEKVYKVKHVPNTHKMIVVYEHDIIVVWDYEAFLIDPIDVNPYPVKKVQAFAEPMYYKLRSSLNLSNLGLEDLDDVEGLSSISSLKELSFKGNNIPENILDTIGGLDQSGNAEEPMKFVKYKEYLKNIKSKSEKIEDRLNVIRSKLKQLKELDGLFKLFGASTHNYELGPPIGEKEIKDYEIRFNITLPEDFRAFLLQVGNGGAGPGYGLYSFDEITRSLENVRDDYFSREFPFSSDRPPYSVSKWEGVRVLDERVKEMDDKIRGTIDICHHGCAIYDFLVLSGEERGRVWVNHSGECILPLDSDEKKNLSFIDWYEHWLDDYISRVEEINDQVEMLKVRFNAKDVGFAHVSIDFPLTSEKPYKTISVGIDLQFHPERPRIVLPRGMYDLIGGHPNISLHTIRYWDVKEESSIIHVIGELEMKFHQIKDKLQMEVD